MAEPNTAPTGGADTATPAAAPDLNSMSVAELAKMPAVAPDGVDKVQWHIRRANAIQMLEQARGEQPEVPATEPEPAPEPSERPRGPDGKFLPAAKANGKAKPAKAAKPEPAATPAETPEPEAETEPEAPAADAKPEPEAEAEAQPDKPEPPVSGTLAKARRLMSEGKFDEAFKAAFGADADTMRPTAKHWAAWRHETREAKAKLAAEKAQLDQWTGKVRAAIADVEGRYGNLIKGKEAFDAGDVQEAVKLAFGVDFTDFQSAALKAVANKDPKLAALERKLAEMEAAAEKRAADDRKARAEAEQARAVADHKRELATEIAAMPVFAGRKVGAGLVDEVFAVQYEHYDAASDTTLTTEEATEIALERIRGRFGLPIDVGEPAAADPERDQDATPPAASTDRDRTPVRPATPAKRPAVANLSQAKAAEASQRKAPPPGTPENIAYWADIAKREMAAAMLRG